MHLSTLVSTMESFIRVSYGAEDSDDTGDSEFGKH